MTEHEMRLIIQQYDCTYGDNPLLIHCPIDKPCMKHKYENLHQKLLEETQTKGLECDKCGWAMKFPDEPCRCELEDKIKQIEASATRGWEMADSLHLAVKEQRERAEKAEKMLEGVKKLYSPEAAASLRSELAQSKSLVAFREHERDKALEKVKLLRSALDILFDEATNSSNIYTHDGWNVRNPFLELPKKVEEQVREALRVTEDTQ